MSIFYNPRKRTTQPWVIVVLVIIPIGIAVGGLIWGTGLAKKTKETKAKEEKIDIFDEKWAGAPGAQAPSSK